MNTYFVFSLLALSFTQKSPMPTKVSPTGEIVEVLPAPDVAMTLAGLAAAAEANHAGLRAAATEVEMVRGRAVQAGLYPNPVVETGSSQWAGSDSQYYATLSQQIMTKGKLRLDRAAVCKEVKQAELKFIQVRFALLTQVRQGYYGLVAAQQRVTVLKNLVDIASKSQETSRKLQKAGEGTKADTLLLDIELSRAKLALENAEALQKAAREQLAAAIGLPDSQVWNVSGTFEKSLPDFESAIVKRAAISQNALVQASQVEAERWRILLRRAEVEPFPNVTVGAGYQYAVTPLHNQALVSISFPIPAWNRNQGSIRTARAGIGKAQETANQAENDLVAQFAAALGRLKASSQQVVRYEKEILPKARESQQITQQSYAQGQIDFLRVLQAQKALVESDLGYIASQEARWSAAAELAGILQEEAFP